MKKPNKADYLTCNQIEYHLKLNEYYEALERYCEYLEAQLQRTNEIRCNCPKEIKTGSVSIHCCNICGKPDESWWCKH
jgi:hypothetical protein